MLPARPPEFVGTKTRALGLLVARARAGTRACACACAYATRASCWERDPDALVRCGCVQATAGVEVTLDASELENMDQSMLKDKYEDTLAAAKHAREDVSDVFEEQVRCVWCDVCRATEMHGGVDRMRPETDADRRTAARVCTLCTCTLPGVLSASIPRPQRTQGPRGASYAACANPPARTHAPTHTHAG